MKTFLNTLKNKYDIFNPPDRDWFNSLKNFLNKNNGSFQDSEVLNKFISHLKFTPFFKRFDFLTLK
jgi:hypothetical protein